MARRRVRSRCGLAVTALLVMLTAGCGLFGPDASPDLPSEADETSVPGPPTGGPNGQIMTVSPEGAGRTCSQSSPCNIEAAVGLAAPGTVIKMVEGEYPKVVLRGGDHLKGAGSAVVVEPAEGAGRPVIAGIDTAVPNVTWRGVKVTDVFMTSEGARGTSLEDVHVSGSGLYARADGMSIKDSLFEGGSSIDGIQVGRASNVLIEGNEIRDYDQANGSQFHADCIQVFDSSDVVIRGNRLRDCYNAGIITSPGSGWGSKNILIESNFIQGCTMVGTACTEGASAADLRHSGVSGLVVRNNTFANGSLRAEPLPGAVFDRNIVDYMSSCEAPFTNSVIADWNKRWCADTPVVRSNGNKEGTVTFVDQAHGDLHLTDLDQARITPTGNQTPAPQTIDRTPTDHTIAGAALLRG